MEEEEKYMEPGSESRDGGVACWQGSRDAEKSANAEIAEEQRFAEGPRGTPAYGRLHGSREGRERKRD
jgi:hypothetical protein